MDKPDSSYSEAADDWKSSTPKEFLNIVLHELRTPMMVIKGYTEILSREENKEHLPEALEAISSSIERIERLYEDMITYVRGLMQNPDP